MGIAWHRSPSRLALIASLLLLVSCAKPPTTPDQPAPPTSEAPATYTFYFEYEPLLTVGLLRNGAPYEGEANLHTQAEPDPTKATAEPEEPQEILITQDSSIKLTFHKGKAQLPPENLQAISEAPTLQLRIGKATVDVPRSRGANPLRCGANIHHLRGIDECTEMLPSEDLIPNDCDAQGGRLWSATIAEKSERIDACFPGLSQISLEKLAHAPVFFPRICPRYAEQAGPNPEDEILLSLSKSCMPYLSAALQRRAVRLHVLRELPSQLESARNGDSLRMHQFYMKYREFSPKEAEEIRKLAAQRFGPKDPSRWFKLRKALESLKTTKYRYTLCDINDQFASVAWSAGGPPRYSDARDFSEEERQPLVPVLMIDVGARARRQYPSTQEQKIVEAIVRQQLGTTKRAVLSTSCTQGKHWYFATQEQLNP